MSNPLYFIHVDCRHADIARIAREKSQQRSGDLIYNLDRSGFVARITTRIPAPVGKNAKNVCSISTVPNGGFPARHKVRLYYSQSICVFSLRDPVGSKYQTINIKWRVADEKPESGLKYSQSLAPSFRSQFIHPKMYFHRTIFPSLRISGLALGGENTLFILKRS